MRVLIYFGIWSLLARFFLSRSLKQDETGDPDYTRRTTQLAAPFLVVYALSVTLGAVDLLMALAPRFYSTMWGVYYFAGSAMVIMALLTVSSRFLQSQGHLQRAITIEHYHDLGKLIFAFTMFWAYIAFSQYMLIWYGNLRGDFLVPSRQRNEWFAFSLLLLFGKWLFPWCGLLSRWVKKRLALLTFFAIWQLCMQWFDMFYMTMPVLKPGQALATLPAGLLVGLGMFGFFVAGAAFLAPTFPSSRCTTRGWRHR